MAGWREGIGRGWSRSWDIYLSVASRGNCHGRMIYDGLHAETHIGLYRRRYTKTERRRYEESANQSVNSIDSVSK